MDKDTEDKILSIETIEDVKEHYKLLSQGITPSVAQLVYNNFASEDKRVDENTEDAIEFIKLLEWFEKCYYIIGHHLEVFTEDEVKEIMNSKCTCECHVEGEKILHSFPCCKNPGEPLYESREGMAEQEVRFDVDGDMSTPIEEEVNEPLSPEQELKQDKI